MATKRCYVPASLRHVDYLTRAVLCELRLEFSEQNVSRVRRVLALNSSFVVAAGKYLSAHRAEVYRHSFEDIGDVPLIAVDNRS